MANASSGGRRWFRVAGDSEPSGDHGPFATEAIELAQAPDWSDLPRQPLTGNATLIAHCKFRIDADLGLLNALQTYSRIPAGSAGPDSTVRVFFTSILPDGATLPQKSQRTFVVVFAEQDTDALPSPIFEGPSRYAADEQWMLLLASSTTYAEWPAHPDSQPETAARLSADWSVMVLRDGVAFLGHRPSSDENPFLKSGCAYARSIYLDTLLLGRLQAGALEVFADEVAALGDPVGQAKRLRSLERRITSFRNQFWWMRVTKQGIANRVLAEYQRQHELVVLADQVFAEMREYANQVQTAAAERTQAIAGFLAALGVVATLGVGNSIRWIDHRAADLGSPIGDVAKVAVYVLLAVALGRWVVGPLLSGSPAKRLVTRKEHDIR